jgi:hypothetical protein
MGGPGLALHVRGQGQAVDLIDQPLRGHSRLL